MRTPLTLSLQMNIKDLEAAVAKINTKNDNARSEAWQAAAQFGAQAVKPLASLLNEEEIEVVRAAKRALWHIVRRAGRPGAGTEAKAVVDELIPLLSTGSTNVRQEALWMLSEIGGDEAVDPMAALLSDPELREDARCTLQRIPGKKATNALKKVLASGPEEFKTAIAQSLRARGEKVEGYPSKKLTPTRQTSVKQASVK
jgi:HEAT repeat protein